MYSSHSSAPYFPLFFFTKNGLACATASIMKLVFFCSLWLIIGIFGFEDEQEEELNPDLHWKLETRFTGNFGWWPKATEAEKKAWAAEFPGQNLNLLEASKDLNSPPYSLPDAAIFILSPMRNDVFEVKDINNAFPLQFVLYNLNLTETGHKVLIYMNNHHFFTLETGTELGTQVSLWWLGAGIEKRLVDGENGEKVTRFMGGRHVIDIVVVDENNEETGVGSSLVIYLVPERGSDSSLIDLPPNLVLPTFGTSSLVRILNPINCSSFILPRDNNINSNKQQDFPLVVELETPFSKLPWNFYLQLFLNKKLVGRLGGGVAAGSFSLSSELFLEEFNKKRKRNDQYEGEEEESDDTREFNLDAVFVGKKGEEWGRGSVIFNVTKAKDDSESESCSEDSIAWGTCKSKPSLIDEYNDDDNDNGRDAAERFIGYSEWWGRANNKRVWLIHALIAARLLNRTLVLPEEYHLLFLRIYDWSNVEKIAKVATSFDVFWNRMEEEKDQVTVVCLKRGCFYRPVFAFPLERNSYQREIVSRFRFIDSSRWTSLSQFVSEMTIPDKFIDVNMALDFVPLTSFDHPLYLSAAGSLPFSREIQRNASEWIARNLGADERFMCVAWRRNDFADFCRFNVAAGEDCFQSIPYTASRVVEQAQFHGLTTVFMTTDGSVAEKIELMERVHALDDEIHIVFNKPDQERDHSKKTGAIFDSLPVWGEVSEDIIEQSVCEQSYAVLLNRWSSFGGTVLGMRRARGIYRDAAF